MVQNPKSPGAMFACEPRDGLQNPAEAHETLGFGQIDLPEQSIETQGCWLAFSER